MSVHDGDPTIRRLRAEIEATDRAILDAVGRRLGLVAELKRYKEAHGITFLDPDRERRLLELLEGANGGRLTSDGLRELHRDLLALTKREVERREGHTPPKGRGST